MAAVTRLETVKPPLLAPIDEFDADMEEEFDIEDETEAADKTSECAAYKGAAAAVAWLIATRWASESCFLKCSASVRAFRNASSNSLALIRDF